MRKQLAALGVAAAIVAGFLGTIPGSPTSVAGALPRPDVGSANAHEARHRVNERLVEKYPMARTANANTPLEQMAGNVPPPIHGHSLATESSWWGSMVGMIRFKSESTTHGSVAACTGPIYQPQWLHLVNATSTGWIEQGTAYWCDGSKSWYGFAAVNYNEACYGTPNNISCGIWTYNIPISGTGTHMTYSSRAGQSGAACNWWGQYIDSTLVASVNLGQCMIGTHLDVGLETYRNWGEFYGPGEEQFSVHGILWDGGSNIWNNIVQWDSFFDNEAQLYYGVPSADQHSTVCNTQNYPILPEHCN